MNENMGTHKINNLQVGLPTTIYYLGAIFVAGVIAGSIAGVVITKEK